MASLKDRLEKAWNDVKGVGEVAIKGGITTAKRAVGNDSPTELSTNAERVLGITPEEKAKAKQRKLKNGSASN